MIIYWTSDDCDGQAILTLHLSVGQVILFPYFDHWFVQTVPMFYNFYGGDKMITKFMIKLFLFCIFCAL